MADNVSIKFTGVNDLLRNIEGMLSNSEKAAAAGLAQTQVDIANHAKQNHPYKNRTHNLENSTLPDPIKQNGDTLTGPVTANMEYAAPVEFGTEKSSPYPFMRPALNANKDKAAVNIAAAVMATNKEVCKVSDKK